MLDHHETTARAAIAQATSLEDVITAVVDNIGARHANAVLRTFNTSMDPHATIGLAQQLCNCDSKIIEYATTRVRELIAPRPSIPRQAILGTIDNVESQ